MSPDGYQTCGFLLIVAKSTKESAHPMTTRPPLLLRNPATLLLLVSASLALVAGTPQPAEAEIIDRIVARINDDIITHYELRQATTPFLLQQGSDPEVLDDPKQAPVIYAEVLKEMIDGQLVLQEAEKLDLKITDEEVDRWLAFTMQQQQMSREQFEALVQRYGMSFEGYREFVRDNLLRLRFIQLKVGSKATVSDAEIDEAYRKRFGEAPRKRKFITVRHILVQPASDADADVAAARSKAEDLLARARAGEDFSELAAAHSDGPSKSSKGYLGSFHRGQLDPKFEDAAFALDEGEISEVARTKFGFHVIKVEEVEHQLPDEIAERKEKLMLELRQQATERQLKSYLQTLRSRAFIDQRL